MTTNAGSDAKQGTEALARFLRDWTELWREELQAQQHDQNAAPPDATSGRSRFAMPPDMSAAMELWRAAMGALAETVGAPPGSAARSRDHFTPPRPEAGAVTPDPRDAAIERLARRVDELEARLAKLETPRRRRS